MSDKKYSKVPITPETFPYVGNNEILVSDDGVDIINGLTREPYRVVPIYKSNGVDLYKRIYIPIIIDGKLNEEAVLAHRIVALAWKPPKHLLLDRLYIKHKDGDILNNHPDNLEWVEYKTNRLKESKVALRNLIDRKTIEYPSLSSLARELKVSGSVLTHYVNKPKILNNSYVIIDENGTWPDMDGFTLLEDKWLSRDKDNVIYKGTRISSENKEVKYFKNQREISKWTNLSLAKINSYLFGDNTGKLLDGWLYESIPKSHFDKLVKEGKVEDFPKRDSKNKKRIKSYCKSTGVETEWESIKAFAKSLNVHEYIVRQAMYRKNIDGKQGHWKDYILSFVD